MEKEIVIPEIKFSLVDKKVQSEIKTQLKALYAGGRIDVIKTQVQADNALEAVKMVKRTIDTLEETRKEIVSPMNNQVKEINEYFKGIKTGLDGMEKTFKMGLAQWQYDLEQQRLEDQRNADKAIEEKKQKDLDDAKALQRKAEETVAEAQVAGISGNSDKAEELMNQATQMQNQAVNLFNAPTSVATSVPEAPKLAGFSTRITYKVEVDNSLSFFKWAAKNEEWGLLEANQKALNKLAAAKGEYFKADGCRLIKEEIASIRK
jgi:hypothetical protein